MKSLFFLVSSSLLNYTVNPGGKWGEAIFFVFGAREKSIIPEILKNVWRFWLKKLSDLLNHRGMSWAYDAAEEREIKKLT